jgi:Protein of unknown function (DUF1569)
MLHHLRRFVLDSYGRLAARSDSAHRPPLRGAIIFDDQASKRGGSMKNLFQREAIDEVIGRIDTLQPATQRQWGKMDVAQMMAHCSATLDMASGRLNTPRAFVGRLIGPFFKSVYTNEKPLSRSSPTDPKLVVSDQRDFLREQEQLKLKVRQFHEGGETQCTRHPHPFFGALPPQDWARGMYKHLDHHLRQFGV